LTYSKPDTGLAKAPHLEFFFASMESANMILSPSFPIIPKIAGYLFELVAVGWKVDLSEKD
jgi:hypothetical protein